MRKQRMYVCTWARARIIDTVKGRTDNGKVAYSQTEKERNKRKDNLFQSQSVQKYSEHFCAVKFSAGNRGTGAGFLAENVAAAAQRSTNICTLQLYTDSTCG